MIKKAFVFVICFLFFPHHSFSYDLKLIGRFATDYAPKSVVISPDEKIAYTMNLEGMSVWAFSTKTHKVLWKLKFPRIAAKGYDYNNEKPINSFANKPVEAAFTKNGRYLWVSLHNARKVVVIDTDFDTDFDGKTMEATLFKAGDKKGQKVTLKSIDVGNTPKVITVAPDQKYVYVANWFSASVSVIDADKLEVTATIPVVRIPRGMAFLPDSHYGYIANMGAELLQKFDEDTNKIIATYHVGLTPRHVVASKDGSKLYITLNRAGELAIFDTKLNKIVKKAKIGKRARTCTLSPDEKYIYVVLYESNKVAVLDAKTLEVLKSIPSYTHPIGVATFDDQVWVVNYSSSSLDIYKATD
jgi:YVTN family beta-propeller protein